MEARSLNDGQPYLPVIWALLLAAAVLFYVVLDGFDLGVGILCPFTRSEKERDQMMNSIAPFWDGNETWLVLGGAGLLVAFPRAYAVIMPAMYLPVIVMLLSLIFRGVSFEFRFVSKPHHRLWDIAFAGGSITLAGFAQGVILGGLIQGITVADGKFAGGAFDWATPFALLCGVGLVAGYGLLGATWLVFRTDGEVAARARRQAQALLVAVLVGIAAVSLWTPLGFPRIAARWFALPNILFLWPVPLATGGAGALRVAGPCRRPRRPALPWRDGAVRAGLPRPRHLNVPISGAADADGVGHRRPSSRTARCSRWSAR